MASGYSRTSAGSVKVGIAGPLTNSHDTSRGVALEHSSVLGKRDFARGILRRLPVGVVRTTIDVVDRLALQLERHAQFDQRLHFSLSGDDAVLGWRDLLQVAGADGRETGAPRSLHVDDAPSGEIALERACCFLFDLRPGRIGNGGKLAMTDYSWEISPFREPISSEPSVSLSARDGEGSITVGATEVSVTAGWSSATASRNVADGTKNRLPVTARLKSSNRS